MQTRIMTKPEPENAKLDLRSGNMRDVLEALEGGIIFVKTLHATHVPRKNCTCNGLTLPRWFVEDNMENLHRSVVLLTDRAWSLRFAIARSRRMIPEVVFSGGWKVFAVSNSLAQGDQLIFKLLGTSKFDVYMFNANGTPKTVVLPNEAAPMNRAEVPEFSMMKVMKSSESRHQHLAAEGSPKASANRSCGFFAKQEIRELTEEQVKDVGEIRDHSPRKKQKSHPSFFKRLPPTSFGRTRSLPCLEIPAGFARTHGNRIGTLVMLQGIYEESPVCTVTCNIWGRNRTEMTRLRLFLNSGWKEFGEANSLIVGQELEFTLTSDSFIVRES